MFTNEQKNAWHNIKAPETLLTQTEKRLEKSPRNTFKYVSLVSLAAVFLLVAGILFFNFENSSNVKIFCQDTLLSENVNSVHVYDRKSFIYSRSLPTTRVDFQIECDGVCEFSVDSGIVSLFSENGELLCDGQKVSGEGKVCLVWSNFDFDSEDTLNLNVKNDKQEYTVFLSCTENADICTVKCIRK